jgi:broad specificity phosphatase PhoE
MVEIHIRHAQASPQTGRLTEEGENQAGIVGKYLRKEFDRPFKVALCSPSTRAAKTAELLRLPSLHWTTDKRLRELSGEGWDEGIARIGEVCEELDIQHSDQNRILVYHGDAMHAARAYREKFMGNRLRLLFEAPYKYFNNGQLIIYSDEDPESGAIHDGKRWVKSVCPWAEGKFGHDWMSVLV